MPTFFKAAAALLMSACLVCGSACSVGGPDRGGKYIVDVIVKKADADFWKVVQMGAEAAGREFGVTVRFKGPSDERDINGEIRLVDDAIQARVDAIVLAASDYTALVGVTEKAVAQKIPVVVIDSDVKSDKTKGFVGTDNVDAGRRLGDTLVQKVGSSCKIAVMGFIRGAATCDQREQGLMDVLAKYPGIQVLAKEYCNSDESYAKILTQGIVEKYPDVDAIVCLNAYGTVGTARGIIAMDKAGSVKIVGFDSTPDEISFLEKGLIQALIVQNPYSMGYLGVKYALDAIHGRPMPKNVNTGSNVVDKDNMYLPEYQKLLFPFTS